MPGFDLNKLLKKVEGEVNKIGDSINESVKKDKQASEMLNKLDKTANELGSTLNKEISKITENNELKEKSKPIVDEAKNIFNKIDDFVDKGIEQVGETTKKKDYEFTLISKRAKEIKPSPTLAFDSRAKAMKAEGIDILNFCAGEPDFDTPIHIKEAAIKAINDGFTKYTDSSGIKELKDAIIEKFKIDNNLDYTPQEIIVSCGAKHTLYNIAQAIFNPGDEVIIPSPFWVSYPEQVILNGAIPVFIKTKEENNFLLDPEELKKAITPKTKAIIINSPSNPTGHSYDRKTLEKIAEIALNNNFYIISDEIYEKLVYDGTKHLSIASFDAKVKQKTIVVNGLSKSHAMTGWRIGYAGGPAEIISAMANIQSHSTSNPNSIAQKAAVAALKGSQDCVSEMVTEFAKRRIILVNGLNSIPNIRCQMPTGAFYAFPNISKLFGLKYDKWSVNSSKELAIYLLESANVALMQGDAFGDDNYLRISYATSTENIEKGLIRLKDAIQKLMNG